MSDIVNAIISVWDASPPAAHGGLILLGGWLAAFLVRAVVRGVLGLFRFDRFADKVGLGEFLKNGGIAYRPARLVGVLTYRLVLLVTFLAASRALDIGAVNRITDSLVQALPSVFAAIFVSAIGLVIVSFLVNVIETIARNTSLKNVSAVVNTFRYIGFAVIALLASDQLGFGKSLLSSLLLIAFAGFILALAIAFGVGSIDRARQTLEGLFSALNRRKENKDEPPESES